MVVFRQLVSIGEDRYMVYYDRRTATVLRPNPNTYTNTEKSNLEKAILNLARDQILKNVANSCRYRTLEE